MRPGVFWAIPSPRRSGWVGVVGRVLSRRPTPCSSYPEARVSSEGPDGTGGAWAGSQASGTDAQWGTRSSPSGAAEGKPVERSGAGAVRAPRSAATRGEGGVEAERDHDRRAVGCADRRRERSERLSQPLLCPFSSIRRQRPLGSVRRGKVARHLGKQALTPLVLTRSPKALTPLLSVNTGACFPSCDGVWVSTRNEPARHRVDTCGEAASQG